MKSPELIVILGPTASGKTRLAALLSDSVGGEIISADSRQVYRGMNLGTGKDYKDYIVDGKPVAYHLIDIAEPGEDYNVFRFQQDFYAAFNDIVSRDKLPILCGGTGLYIESVLGKYSLSNVPENKPLRAALMHLSQQELSEYLRRLKPVHNTTDLLDHERTLRAIEIATHESGQPSQPLNTSINAFIFGLNPGREQVRMRITTRLQQRLKEGMIEEVQGLVERGVTMQMLDYYGLEYRYIARYIAGLISYDQMFARLNIAIHQFAKRQMTWFRRMERIGFVIHWLDKNMSDPEKVAHIIKVSNH